MLPTPCSPRFDQILAQPRAIATLTAAINSRHIHHAWIFSGPFGVGKRTTAEAFAALLLDPTTGVGLTGQLAAEEGSPTQRMLGAGTHPDFHFITKELAAYSDDSQVRRAKQVTIPKAVIEKHLLEQAALAPQIKTDALAKKVFIIDEAERLDRSRTNAPTQASMLKTLEEPPPGTVIILVTSSEERLLPTIRSRCQRVSFSPLSDADMDEWLSRTDLDLSGAERDWTLGFASGSPGRAIAAIETGLYAWRSALAPMLEAASAGRLDPALGPTMHKLTDTWAADSVKRDKKEGFEASKDIANRTAAGHLFTLLAERARADLRNAIGDPDQAAIRLHDITAIDEAERRLASNVNPQMVFDALAAKLATPEPDPMLP